MQGPPMELLLGSGKLVVPYGKHVLLPRKNVCEGAGCLFREKHYIIPRALHVGGVGCLL